MSFILDAIAKSERERQQQQLSAPQILAMPASPVPQPRGLLPYIVVGALLLNAVVLYVWMQSGQTLLASAVQPPATPVTGEDTQPSLATPSTVEPTATVVTAARVVAPEQASPEVAAEPVVQPEVTVASAREVKSAISDSDDAPGNSTSQPTNDDVPGDWIRIGPDTLSNRAQSGRAAEPAQRASGSLTRVSSLSELPGDVRDDLPNVVFSGHLYSSDPTSSIVFVDEGRPVTQGRRIADDLYLHEITPTGVVVEFRGYLIDVGVLQNWTLN